MGEWGGWGENVGMGWMGVKMGEWGGWGEQ